ncbi:hypothetical protein RDI58_015906 [Solanum bulbocastanum]|uniref:Uncharacterized protein n=1 Tax=Solanum bulbocastanum TaxID=147425 RepID=A0AAN8TKY5_SOLBU
MVKLTMIARVTDGLPLAEGLDDSRDVPDADYYKQQVKSLFKNLSMGHNEASRMSIESGPYIFHYIIEGRICYLTMCDRSYPKKLAFQYLEDLKNEFERVNGSQIETAARPYAFIKFDTFIQKTKKLYQDTRTQRNVAKLNDELYEVHQIMTRNVQEVLGVGEKLDQVSQMSSRLTSESRIYADKARDLNRQHRTAGNWNDHSGLCGWGDSRHPFRPMSNFIDAENSPIKQQLEYKFRKHNPLNNGSIFKLKPLFEHQQRAFQSSSSRNQKMDSEQPYDVSEIDSDYDSDDSQDDPTFDLLEETQSSLSKLSIKKQKSMDMSARRNVSKALEDCVEEEEDLDEIEPELDEKDKKSYETVQKIIKAGQIEKLKVEQCKVYLRKHGLRLTGTKDTLIQRIKEHTDILDGRGEEKYPPSSFVLNCKGDACTGDVVMFEQNVYEMFSIASRSATGPPCGTRIVAGRIVKESYGAKKQQHTFTVEVLWSKGEKSLPPLHPLLIKGRNLYRLKTLRQKWDDEAERQKILSEKHARGSVARSSRETRVQEKEMRKMRRENRVSTDYKEKKTVAESKGKQLHSRSMNSLNKNDQPQVEVVYNGQKDEQKEFRNYTNVIIQENVYPRENRPEERHNQRQPLTNVNLNDRSSNREKHNSNMHMHYSNMHNSNTHMPMWRGSSYGGNTNNYNIPTWRGYSDGSYNYCNTSRSPLRGHGHMYTGGHGHSQNYKSPQRTENWQARNGKRPFQGQSEEQKKPCHFYAQGRCYYGHSCKYLHDSVDI